MKENLRSYRIEVDYTNSYMEQIDYSTSVEDASVEVIFSNHKERLLELIGKFPNVCGCVAWLTDLEILEAMRKMDHVSIIVQKEDFLRPDDYVNSLYNSGNYYAKLRSAYNALPAKFSRYGIDNIVNDLSVCGDPTIEPVRCMGNHNSEKSPSFPRMHNKFLVFTDSIEYKDSEICKKHSQYDFKYEGSDLQKLLGISVLGISDNACVWTGSYNLSHTATKSLENAVIIHNKEIAQAYFNEWGQITALSERLNWESEWVKPEWRLGT